MAAKQFFNVVKANAEIARLDAEVTKLTTERDEAVKAASENNGAAVAAAETATQRAETAESALAAANQRISTLTAAAGTEASKLANVTKERDDAKAVIADPKGEIAKQASAQAQQITASQGQPPLKTTPADPTGAAASTMKRADFMALAPVKQAEFVRGGGKVVD